ncbi:MAG: diguanylate cyclase [Campylobacterota bacterium]|nr:diguanylate cyclase [Campylobacterota bacterium]
MQFIEALKLRSRLFFLFILITVGLVSVGVMGSMHLNSMKKSIDSLYFGSLMPVNELNEIIRTYNSGLVSTIQKASREEISSSQTAASIEKSLIKIERVWKKYESHFKRDDELEYLEYAALEIKSINSYFIRILKASYNERDLSALSLTLLDKKISHINMVIQKLINYETSVASYERKSFLQHYNNITVQLGIVLSLIIAGILLISLYVFMSIQKDHSKLEETMSKLRRANKKLENVSYTDSLTSLHNRRYFNMVYDREMKRAKRAKNYITFMMLDIDYFKQYNDTYGHIEGDFALKSVAKVLKDTLKRPSDFVFRLGGEEFGVLLTNTDETNSAKLAREICDAIRERKLLHKSSKAHEYLTMSIGVVCCIADDALNEDVLISRADEMLYEAKETGRDRYIITSNVSEAKAQIIEDISA